MNAFDKIKKSWWVILSLVMFLNGMGFLYIGFKHNNRNWVIEGITYEIPWFFYFVIYAIYGVSVQSTSFIAFSLLLMLVSIIRSVWVAIKLADVYENNEKYTIKQTNLNHTANNQNNNNSSNFSCCICILCIFFILALIAIL